MRRIIFCVLLLGLTNSLFAQTNWTPIVNRSFCPNCTGIGLYYKIEPYGKAYCMTCNKTCKGFLYTIKFVNETGKVIYPSGVIYIRNQNISPVCDMADDQKGNKFDFASGVLTLKPGDEKQISYILHIDTTKSNFPPAPNNNSSSFSYKFKEEQENVGEYKDTLCGNCKGVGCLTFILSFNKTEVGSLYHAYMQLDVSGEVRGMLSGINISYKRRIDGSGTYSKEESISFKWSANDDLPEMKPQYIGDIFMDSDPLTGKYYYNKQYVVITGKQMDCLTDDVQTKNSQTPENKNIAECQKSIEDLITTIKKEIEALKSGCSVIEELKKNKAQIGGGGWDESIRQQEEANRSMVSAISTAKESLRKKANECNINVVESFEDISDCSSSQQSLGNNNSAISQQTIQAATDKAINDINIANNERDNRLSEIDDINSDQIDDGSGKIGALPDYNANNGVKKEFGNLNTDKFKQNDTINNKDNFESSIDQGLEKETMFEPNNIDEIPGSTPCEKFSYVDHLITVKKGKHENIDNLNIIHDSIFKQCTGYLELKNPAAENTDTIATESNIPSECAELAKFRDNELYQLFDNAMKEYELNAMKKAEFVKRKSDVLAIDFNNADKNLGVIVMSIGAACDATKSLLELLPSAKLFSVGEKAIFYTTDIIKSYFTEGKSINTIVSDIVISEVLAEINPALSALNTMNSYYSKLKEIKQFSQEAKTQIEVIQEQIKTIDNTIQFYDNKINKEKEKMDNITLIANAISEYCAGNKKK